MMPVMNPATVQDMIDLGLAGIALSRFSGLWTVLKMTAETAEQSGLVVVPSERGFVRPEWRPLPTPWDTTLPSLSRPTAPYWNAGWKWSVCPRPWPGRGPTGSTGWCSAAPTRRSGW